MNQLKIKYYKSIFLRIKRGNNRGVFSNTKPLFVVSIIDSVSKGIAKDNIFKYPIEPVASIYSKNFQQYAPDEKETPFYMPFYHLSSEEFWHLQWNDEKSNLIAHSPSAKYLRENVKYASLDNALWDLLQNAEARTILRETIINHFLKSVKHS